MIICVIDYIDKECQKSNNDNEFLVGIKRCKAHWYNTLKKLKKEGITLDMKEDSFETIIQNHPIFKDTAETILKAIK